MKKIFTSLVVAVGYFLAADNAAAAISVLPTPNTSSQIFLTFDGANLTVSNIGYALRMGYDMEMNRIALGDYNSSYSEDGFTPGSVSAEIVISSNLTYDGNYYSSTLPNSAYYGFKYGTGSGSSIQYHYGWVNLTVSNGALTLNSAAINTIAGESILAGQTAVTAVPEPGMWMPSLVLVLGVAFRRRRSRSKATVV